MMPLGEDILNLSSVGEGSAFDPRSDDIEEEWQLKSDRELRGVIRCTLQSGDCLVSDQFQDVARKDKDFMTLWSCFISHFCQHM